MKLTTRDLKHFINNDKIDNIYLLSGPEIGEKLEIIKLIEKKLFGEKEPIKYTFYCGDEFDVIELIDTLRSGLLFEDKKIVLLKNIEAINNNSIKYLEDYIIPKSIDKNKFESLILNKITNEMKRKNIANIYIKNREGYLLKSPLTQKDKKSIIETFYSIGFKNYDENTYLIMMNEGNDRIPKNLFDIVAYNQHIIFWEMFESQKIEWIRKEFKKYDLFITDDAVIFILDMIENNKAQLENEISKISLLYKEKKDIIKKDVIDCQFIEEYIFHSKNESPFTLYSAILNKDMDKAFGILDNLFLSDEMGLLNGLAWSHRRFLKALDLYENQKMPVIDIYMTMKITAKKNKEDFENGFNNYDFEHASMMFFCFSELDYYLKILPSKLKLVKLQEFIVKFINGDGDRSFLRGPLQYLQS